MGWNRGDVNELMVCLGDKGIEVYKALSPSISRVFFPIVAGITLSIALSLLWPQSLSPQERSRFSYFNLIPIAFLIFSMLEEYYIWMIMNVWPTQETIENFVLFGSVSTIIKSILFALCWILLIFGMIGVAQKRCSTRKVKTQ